MTEFLQAGNAAPLKPPGSSRLGRGTARERRGGARRAQRPPPPSGLRGPRSGTRSRSSSGSIPSDDRKVGPSRGLSWWAASGGRPEPHPARRGSSGGALSGGRRGRERPHDAILRELRPLIIEINQHATDDEARRTAVATLFARVVPQTDALVRMREGSRVLQTVVRHGTPAQRAAVLTRLLEGPHDLARLLSEPYSLHTVRQFVHSARQTDLRERLYTAILSARTFSRFVTHRKAGHVIAQMYGSATPPLRARLLCAAVGLAPPAGAIAGAAKVTPARTLADLVHPDVRGSVQPSPADPRSGSKAEPGPCDRGHWAQAWTRILPWGDDSGHPELVLVSRVLQAPHELLLVLRRLGALIPQLLSKHLGSSRLAHVLMLSYLSISYVYGLWDIFYDQFAALSEVAAWLVHTDAGSACLCAVFMYGLARDRKAALRQLAPFLGGLLFHEQAIGALLAAVLYTDDTRLLRALVLRTVSANLAPVALHPYAVLPVLVALLPRGQLLDQLSRLDARARRKAPRPSQHDGQGPDGDGAGDSQEERVGDGDCVAVDVSDRGDDGPGAAVAEGVGGLRRRQRGRRSPRNAMLPPVPASSPPLFSWLAIAQHYPVHGPQGPMAAYRSRGAIVGTLMTQIRPQRSRAVDTAAGEDAVVGPDDDGRGGGELLLSPDGTRVLAPGTSDSDADHSSPDRDRDDAGEAGTGPGPGPGSAAPGMGMPSFDPDRAEWVPTSRKSWAAKRAELLDGLGGLAPLCRIGAHAYSAIRHASGSVMLRGLFMHLYGVSSASPDAVLARRLEAAVLGQLAAEGKRRQLCSPGDPAPLDLLTRSLLVPHARYSAVQKNKATPFPKWWNHQIVLKPRDATKGYAAAALADARASDAPSNTPSPPTAPTTDDAGGEPDTRFSPPPTPALAAPMPWFPRTRPARPLFILQFRPARRLIYTLLLWAAVPQLVHDVRGYPGQRVPRELYCSVLSAPRLAAVRSAADPDRSDCAVDRGLGADAAPQARQTDRRDPASFLAALWDAVDPLTATIKAPYMMELLTAIYLLAPPSAPAAHPTTAHAATVLDLLMAWPAPANPHSIAPPTGAPTEPSELVHQLMTPALPKLTGYRATQILGELLHAELPPAALRTALIQRLNHLTSRSP